MKQLLGLLFLVGSISAFGVQSISDFEALFEAPVPKLVCPKDAGPSDCQGQEEGTRCLTYGPHGGKIEGDCRFVPESKHCGCFYVD